jgi:hypothetical protein
MKKKKNLISGRRGFICTLSGILSGILFAAPSRLQAKKTEIKELLRDMDFEILESSKPEKNPSIICNDSPSGKISLFRKEDGKIKYICAMNPVGMTIWEECNGSNTPRDISKLLHDKYRVSPNSAHVDCLVFLMRLRQVGAIRITR